MSDFWNLTDNGIMKKEYPIPIQTRMFVPYPTQDSQTKYVY